MAVIVGLNVAVTYRALSAMMDQSVSEAAWAKRQAVVSALFAASRFASTVAVDQESGGDPTQRWLRILALNPGYVAIRRSGGGATFEAATVGGEQALSIAAAFDTPMDGAPDIIVRDTQSKVWFRPASAGEFDGFIVRTVYLAAGEKSEVSVFLSEDQVRRVIANIEKGASDAAHLAILTPDGRRFAEASDDSDEANGDLWLPKQIFAPQRASFKAESRDGRERLFGVAPLTQDGTVLLIALSAPASRAVAAQLGVAFLVPIATLLILALIFVRTVKTNVLVWVDGLDEVARANTHGGVAHALVSSRMPIEFENVARSMNTMIDARQKRETQLSDALTHNNYLARELHHRVKNSLQLVQSYLSLGAREAGVEAKSALCAAQCRAYILSAAYRRAFDEGEIRPFEIDPFLADVVNYSVDVMRGAEQKVSFKFETNGMIGIDEAIPLGMIVVEFVEQALKLGDALEVRLQATLCGDGGEEHLILAVGTDKASLFPQQSRLLKGLLRQLRAVPSPPPPGMQTAVCAPLPAPVAYTPTTFV
jgi:two-component sensor histidine kinase